MGKPNKIRFSFSDCRREGLNWFNNILIFNYVFFLLLLFKKLCIYRVFSRFFLPSCVLSGEDGGYSKFVFFFFAGFDGEGLGTGWVDEIGFYFVDDFSVMVWVFEFDFVDCGFSCFTVDDNMVFSYRFFSVTF